MDTEEDVERGTPSPEDGTGGPPPQLPDDAVGSEPATEPEVGTEDEDDDNDSEEPLDVDVVLHKQPTLLFKIILAFALVLCLAVVVMDLVPSIAPLGLSHLFGHAAPIVRMMSVVLVAAAALAFAAWMLTMAFVPGPKAKTS